MITKYKLSDVCKIIMGQSPVGSSYNTKNIGLPLLNGAADYKGQQFNPKQFTTETTQIAKKGDVIFGVRATIGNFAIADRDYCIGRGVAALRVNEKIAEKSYIIQLVENEVAKMKDKAAGSTIKGIRKDDLVSLSIPLPPLAEQQRIAKILDAADSLRKKTQQIIDSYDELAQSVFLDMFGDPAINSKKWQKKTVGDFIKYIGDIGSNGSNETVAKNLEMLDFDDYAIMIRTVNLNSNNFNKNIKYVTKKTYDFFSKSKIFGGEIIMNKIGSAGEFWIMPNLGRPVTLGLNQFVIRVKDLNIIYLFYFLSTQYGKLNIKMRTRGVATKSITKSAVKELPLLFPPLSLQNQFAEKIQLIEKQKELAKQSLKESDDLFNALLQKAFKGELSN